MKTLLKSVFKFFRRTKTVYQVLERKKGEKVMKFKTLSSVLLLAALLVGCGDQENETSGAAEDSKTPEKQIVLRLAENQVEDYPTTIGDKEFAKLVEEKTDGRYKIEVYAGGQLGDEKSIIEQVQLGTIELARVNASPLTDFASDLGVLSMPYLFKDDAHQWDILNGDIGEELLSKLEPSNMVGLAFYDSGSRNFYNSVRPIQNPSDLKGLKIRVQQSSLFVDLVESFGASATPMAYDEVYSSLQTGVIDGAENNYPSYYSTNHYEVAKYYTIDSHSRVPEVLMASKSTWDKLSDEDKKIFKDAAVESQKVQREAWKALEEKSKAAVLEAGSEVIEITDTTPWREAVQPLYDKYGEGFAEIIGRIQK